MFKRFKETLSTAYFYIAHYAEAAMWATLCGVVAVLVYYK